MDKNIMISGFSLDHGSKANTIQFIQNNYGRPDWPDHGRMVEGFQRKHMVAQILRCPVQVRNLLCGLLKDIAAQEEPQTVKSPSTAYCFIKDFEETSSFKDNVDKYVKQYPDLRDHKYITEILDERNHRQVLSDWHDSSRSSALLLKLEGGSMDRSNWTTDFTLETMGCVNELNKAGAQAGAKTSTVLTHFCNTFRKQTYPWTQKVILHDILAQLRKDRLQNLMHDCKALKQADSIFHDNSQDASHLWKLLRHSTANADLESLYILLDNIDTIYGDGNQEELRKFYHNMQTFLESLDALQIPVKLLATSRGSLESIRCFGKFIRNADVIALTKSLPERYR